MEIPLELISLINNRIDELSGILNGFDSPTKELAVAEAESKKINDMIQNLKEIIADYETEIVILKTYLNLNATPNNQ